MVEWVKMRRNKDRENRKALGVILREHRDSRQMARDELAERLKLELSEFRIGDFKSFIISVEHGSRIFHSEDRIILVRVVSILNVPEKKRGRIFQLIGELCPQKLPRPRMSFSFFMLRNRILANAHLFCR